MFRRWYNVLYSSLEREERRTEIKFKWGEGIASCIIFLFRPSWIGMCE